MAVVESVYRRRFLSRDGKRTGQSANGIKVGRLSLAEDEGGGDIIGRGVGDGVGVASNDTLGREFVDLEGSDESSKGRGGKDSLEEAHGGGLERERGVGLRGNSIKLKMGVVGEE